MSFYKSDLNYNRTRYQTMPICPALTFYVKSIEVEVFDSNDISNISPYRILPDFSVVIGFQYSGSIYVLEKDRKKQLNVSGVSGLQTQQRIFQPACVQTKTILVRLFPWAVNTLFNENAYHLTNHALGLSEIVGRSSISRLEEQLATTVNPKELSRLVQVFLLNLLKSHENNLPPKYIVALAKQLANFDAVDTIEQLAKDYGVSQRNLERQFKNIIGLSPKKFLRLSQFQKALYHLRNDAHWEQIIDRLSYYDQAHFINSFKQFSGFAPSQFMASIDK